MKQFLVTEGEIKMMVNEAFTGMIIKMAIRYIMQHPDQMREIAAYAQKLAVNSGLAQTAIQYIDDYVNQMKQNNNGSVANTAVIKGLEYLKQLIQQYTQGVQ